MGLQNQKAIAIYGNKMKNLSPASQRNLSTKATFQRFLHFGIVGILPEQDKEFGQRALGRAGSLTL